MRTVGGPRLVKLILWRAEVTYVAYLSTELNRLARFNNKNTIRQPTSLKSTRYLLNHSRSCQIVYRKTINEEHSHFSDSLTLSVVFSRLASHL